jgi:hypothetical protein
MKYNYFSRKKRQFISLSKRVNNLIFKGEWEILTIETRNNLIHKLNRLFKELSHFCSHTELKKILAAAVIFIGFPLISNSQSFAPPQLNPFGLMPDSVSLASPVFADIDHDNDLDLFSGIYGGAIQFYENTGTADAPHFGMRQQNPFGINPPMSDYIIAFPDFADIDGDGDLDLFTGGISEQGDSANFRFYENTGTDASPAFAAPQLNPFGLTPALMFSMIRFADIDNDGDLDLFVGEQYGNFKFYENTGSETLASFAAPVQNPFGLTPVNTFGSPAFSDIDHDGDLDLFVGEYYGNMRFFENTGTNSSPAFASPLTNPFGLVQTNYYNFPAFADLDNDGDEDILTGELYGSFQYFKNNEFNVGITENDGGFAFNLYPNPATDGVFIGLNNVNPDFSAEVRIIDLNGRVIKTVILNSDDLRLKTDDLSPGIYFVRLKSGNKEFTRKMAVR